DRVAQHEGENGRNSRVQDRALELAAVAADRVPVVAPSPGERVAEVDAPRLQRLVGEEAERDEEEDAQPEHPRREQQVGRQPTMAVEEAHSLRLLGRAAPRPRMQRRPHQAEIRFCQAVWYFSLLRAVASMMWTLSSIFFVGKIRVMFDMLGSIFSSACFAPVTGQM